MSRGARASFRRTIAARAIGLEDQLAQEFIRRLDRGLVEDELFLARVFFDQAEPELKILEEMGAEIVHLHPLGGRSLDQPVERGIVKLKLDPMLARKLIGKLHRLLPEGFLFVLLTFRHQALEDALRFADQFFSDAQLA